MVTAYEVAKWFLGRESMTHKKLQKLCYYAQAWYCALNSVGESLFGDAVEAWVHGPVVPSLYRLYTDYKWNPIPQAEGDESRFDKQTTEILEAVYDTYGDFSGDQLEALACSEKPWRDTRRDLNPGEISHSPISCTSLREYYLAKYKESQSD